MGKIMVSLSEKAEGMVRKHITKEYHDRVGALSIFFDQLVMDYFANKKKEELKPAPAE